MIAVQRTEANRERAETRGAAERGQVAHRAPINAA